MRKFDRTNAVLAGVVYLGSFIVYAMTVQPSIPFWDCGEFIACSYILGIPHPPGTPLFVLIGRIFSLIPLSADIAHRVNFISVFSSALAATFSYLLTVRLVGYFFGADKDKPLNRIIAYVGGIAGAFFVAFSETNWSNSVEAEVYGLAMAVMTMIAWLTLKYYEIRGTQKASRLMVLVFYLAMLGIGIHMTVYLIVPIVALFFILDKGADRRDWIAICSFIILELAFIIIFADGRGGVEAFYLVSALMGTLLMVMLYRRINWAVLIAIGCLSLVMIAFGTFFEVAPFGVLLLLILGYLSRRYGWNFQWKTALAVLLIGFVGFSVHLYLPVRSALNPRIDQNNPARDYRTFVNYLDRKQYGQESMVDRMFHRRGSWENQFGRHPNMGFWSYFEEQYAGGGWWFVPLFALGLLGMAVAILKRLEIGLPFFTLFLICSVGLILYMNFADGTRYSFTTGDAYLEVRNRDYFFTPAFVFFGIAMGMGVSALITLVRDFVGRHNPGLQKAVVYGGIALALLPGFSLANNYHTNDRSGNYLAYNYSKNILDSCDKDAILFTTGDNDTFPVWCLQEVYNYRQDVRIVNLSLLNTDWYVAQMKNKFDVPISLSDEQILWYPYEVRPGVEGQRPKVMFNDRPRGVRAYLQAYQLPGTNQVVSVADMMVDEIVIQNRWRWPIYFSSPPYAESPLKLRDHTTAVGILYRLDREPEEGRLDVAKSYDLFMHSYSFKGLEDSKVFRDDNATGVFMPLGSRAVTVWDALLKDSTAAATDSALALMNMITTNYPEYWQAAAVFAEYYEAKGDSAKALETAWKLHDTLSAFLDSNPKNRYYRQDLGMAKVELGQRLKDTAMIDRGVDLVWEGFRENENDSFAFRKLATTLYQIGRYGELQEAAELHAQYKKNLEDPFLQQFVGSPQQGNAPPPVGP